MPFCVWDLWWLLRPDITAIFLLWLTSTSNNKRYVTFSTAWNADIPTTVLKSKTCFGFHQTTNPSQLLLSRDIWMVCLRSSCPQIAKDILLVFKEKTVALAVKEVTISWKDVLILSHLKKDNKNRLGKISDTKWRKADGDGVISQFVVWIGILDIIQRYKVKAFSVPGE